MVGAEYQFVTRRGCHLCDLMAAELREVLPEYGILLETVDVDSRADLVERFGESVPVLLRDGRPVAKVRLQPGQLVRILERRR